ncbi:MAG: hypothetical protein GX369_03465 [Euryarchaeota archaeon]|nr:hypothetical protein [Euryarchaeota archaeon]
MRKPPVILFLEPFVLLATAMAALLLILYARLHRLKRNSTGRRLLALQCCAIPLIVIAILVPSFGPVALLCFFGLAMMVLMGMRRDA